MDRKRLILGLLGLAALGGCDDPQESWQPAERTFRDFYDLQAAGPRVDVYPVLMRDCGFPTCHGSEERAFRIYGPGRSRLTDDVRSLEKPTGDELSLSFSLARSMIDAEHPERSLLLLKPLAIEAGGAAHGGIDDFGRNVYRTKNDAGYKVIERWVLELPPSACDQLDACCASLKDEESATLCGLAAPLARMQGSSFCAASLPTFCDPDDE